LDFFFGWSWKGFSEQQVTLTKMGSPVQKFQSSSGWWMHLINSFSHPILCCFF
jgi:hypothetical protein